MNARFDAIHGGCLVLSSSFDHTQTRVLDFVSKMHTTAEHIFFIIPTFSIVNDQQPLTIFIVTT